MHYKGRNDDMNYALGQLHLEIDARSYCCRSAHGVLYAAVMAVKISQISNKDDCMHKRHIMSVLAVVVALGAPTIARAQDLRFNYLEGGLIAGFVNDVEESAAFTTWSVAVRLTL